MSKAIFYKNIKVVLRYTKIFEFNNKLYIIGSKFMNEEGLIKKYWLVFYELDSLFNIIPNTEIEFDFINKNNLLTSSFIRDIYLNTDDKKLYLNIELKNNINNTYFEHDNYLISTNNLKNFKIEKKYDTKDFLFKDLEGNLFCSKIEEDKDFPNFNWGIYLYEFIINNKKIIPNFDKIVDYKKDKGHVLHNIIKNNDEYILLFSIRHLVNNIPEFEYRNYLSKTKNLIDFYETQEILFEDDFNNSDFYSYPNIFMYKDIYYLNCNQDEYGKSKDISLFKIIF